MSTSPSPTVAEVAAALIRVFEGLRLTAYRDSGGVWTIGYGHTGLDVKPGLVITQAQAESYLQQDAEKLFQTVEGYGTLAAAALVSFGYNCGLGALERVIAGHSILADYVHDAHGNELAGLVARRGLEEILIALDSSKVEGKVS